MLHPVEALPCLCLMFLVKDVKLKLCLTIVFFVQKVITNDITE
jgi:hypothetical protein